MNRIRWVSVSDGDPASKSNLSEVPVPRPAFWGGWLLRPQRFEFWQGRPSRLHDRLRYTAEPTDGAATNWQIERLAP